jgi:aspartyl-tRNA(Asn)/glutamyl-tRNA(Gln) amidotransferase subunit C
MSQPTQQPLALDDVRKVAKLARLALPDDRLQKLAGELASILHYVEKINQVDTAGIEPMAHALPVRNVLRGDVPEPGLSIDGVLGNAPETDGRFFKVPKVIGGDDEDSAG